MTQSIEDLQELLYKNRKIMPEGDYIKMMEYLSNIYKNSQTGLKEDCEYECPHCSSYISSDELEEVH